MYIFDLTLVIGPNPMYLRLKKRGEHAVDSILSPLDSIVHPHAAGFFMRRISTVYIKIYKKW